MNNEQHIDLITAYIDGSLTPDQRARFNTLVDEGEIDILQVKEMESLYAQMDKLPDVEPDSTLQDRFYTMLAEEQQKNTSSPSIQTLIKQWIERLQHHFTMQRAIIACGIFAIGMLIGNWMTPSQHYRSELSALSTEVSQMREVMMMSLLDDKSATERLKAVNISTDIQSVDSRITDALFRTLNNDPNVNVRLAAVEALVQHASAPMVREGLVASIQKQESPLVQAALADAMLILQERQSIDEFQQLLDEGELNPSIRTKLENTVAALS